MPTQSDMMRVSQRNEISPNADGVSNATRWECKLPSNGELRPVTAFQLANIKADLHRYLRKKKTLVSPEFSAVVADVSSFISAVVRDGFEEAFSQLPNVVPALSGRSFMKMAVESEEKTEVDEAWAKAVAMAIDAQLLHIPLNPNQRQESTHVSGHKE